MAATCYPFGLGLDYPERNLLFPRPAIAPSLRSVEKVRKGVNLDLLPIASTTPGRVENRSSGCSLPVAVWLGFRFAASIRFGLPLFPVPAHRTGQAELPHPALGKDSRSRPRKTGGPLG